MSVSDVPLLNEYKQEFVKKRLPQTLLGGPKVNLGYKAPCYVYGLQILVWLLPFIIGGTFTLLTDVVGLSIFVSAPICGALMGCFVLIVQIVHLSKAKQSNVVEDIKTELTASQQLHHLLADDDEIDFDSVFSFVTFKFIFPPLRFYPSVIFHFLFSVALCGFAVWYTLPSNLSILYGNNVGAVVVIYSFSWIAICIAQYPLNSGGIPPEVATFHSIDVYDVAPLSRALHVFIFFAFCIVELFFPSYQAVNQVLHIVFLFLPFLWIIGLLPPIDAFFLWIAEQVMVFGLGGSPCATDTRLLISLLISGAVLIGASFITSISVLVPVAAGFGFLLSTDFVSLIYFAFYKLFCRSNAESQRNFQQTHFNNSIFLVNVGAHMIVFSMLALTVILSMIFHTEAIFNVRVISALEITFIVMFLLSKLLQDIQRVYVFFRLFRNCFYPKNSAMPTTRNGLTQPSSLAYMILTSVINPLIMSAYLSLFLFVADADITSFVSAVGAVHGFRMIWQRTNNALLCFVVMSVIRLSITFANTSFGSLDVIRLGTLLLIIDISLDRVCKFFDNLWLVLALLVTSWKDKKQRRDSSLCLLVSNIILFPIVLFVVGLASALAAPILPLFTLPIFMVGFPRPSRFWPQTAGSASASLCSDTSHYEKMVPGVVASMIKGISGGKYATMGDADLPFYIARSQDKTFWIQTLESGYGYVSLSVKGLELQETSCHALEATRLDDACQAAFQPALTSTCCRTNPFSFLYAVTPIHTEFVDGYSDAKNSLSGIIDYPDAIKQVHNDFMKSLLWLLVHLLSKKKTAAAVHINEENISHTTHKTIPSPFTLRNSKVHSAVKSSNAVPLGLLKSKNSSRESEQKRRKSPFAFQKLNKVSTLTDPSSPSLGSLASILASDSETSVRKAKQKKNISPPGVLDASDDLWELDSDLSDSGFGLSVKNVFAKSNTVEEKDNPVGKMYKLNPNSSGVTGWGETPFTNIDFSPYLKLFDRSWYLHVAALVEDTNWGVEEDQLLSACRDVALTCYMLVFAQGIPGRDPSTVGPSHFTKVFGGDVPWSPELEWLTERNDLHNIVIQALRYSMKTMYDRVAMGTVDVAAEETHDDTVTSLQELDSDWFIGPESGLEWKLALENGVPSLFSIHFDSSKNEYSARVLLRRAVETHVCRTSSAAVRSIWANLSLEMLYATNDDEERYSIQAHPNLIRNLTVQAADPPLGYPIYSSSPFYANVIS